MTRTEFEAMQRAWEDYPSQDNEGYRPDRGGFKAGWAACLRWVRSRQENPLKDHVPSQYVQPSDTYQAHHCRHGTRGVYCFDFHASYEREKCDQARQAAFNSKGAIDGK